MGTWGHDTFDNDTAADWASTFAENGSLQFVEKTLDEVLTIGDDYLDSDFAVQGLAAAEVVARLQGRWGVRSAYSENADKWVEANAGLEVPAELTDKALKLIDRVLGPESELVDLWEGAPDWHKAVADLRSRVRP